MEKIKRNEYVTGGNVPVRYRIEDIPLMRRQYHPGQKLILKFPRFIGYGKRYINEYKEYTVVAPLMSAYWIPTATAPVSSM